MGKRLIIKKILNIKLITSSCVFVYLFFINLTYANENFIVTTVNKFPISKIDVINKAKVLQQSNDKNLDKSKLNMFYDKAIDDLISEKVVLSEGLKINENIEKLVTQKAESLLLSTFNNSEAQLSDFLRGLSIPKSTLLEKYKAQLILGYIVKNKYKAQLTNLEKFEESKINLRRSDNKQDLFDLAEIVLNKKNNAKLYKTIQQALQNGENFLKIASQVSISSSAKFNGKIGWKTYEEVSKIIQTKKTIFLEGDIFSFSTADKVYFYKILATRIKGKLSQKENKVLLVEAKFPINFRKKEEVYFEVKKTLENILSHKSKCNNFSTLKNSNELKISLNTIKSRIADISPNIEYLINNIKLYELSNPLFRGNFGFCYIICDIQDAKIGENSLRVIKNKIMNKHFANLSNKLLKRLVKQAQITQIQKIN